MKCQFIEFTQNLLKKKFTHKSIHKEISEQVNL